MTNFEQKIKEMMENGMDSEAIAAEFTKTLNKLEAEAKASNERVKLLKSYEDLWTEVEIEVEAENPESLACYVTIQLAEAHPEWTVDIIKSFKESIEDCIKMTEKVCTAAANGNPETVLMEILKEFTNFLPTREKESAGAIGKSNPIYTFEPDVEYRSTPSDFMDIPKVSFNDKDKVDSFMRQMGF